MRGAGANATLQLTNNTTINRKHMEEKAGHSGTDSGGGEANLLVALGLGDLASLDLGGLGLLGLVTSSEPVPEKKLCFVWRDVFVYS